MPANTLSAMYMNWAADRETQLDRARLCAALTKPWVLPPSSQDKNERLPENYQSVGSRGMTNLEGRVLMGVFPPQMPWFTLSPAAAITLDPTIDPRQVEAFRSSLFTHELLIQAMLESAGRSKRNPTGFRTSKRAAISQLLITGDVLERINDDYSITVIRRDRYVNKIDDAGNAVCHIIQEKIDPTILTDDQLETIGLKRDELVKKPYNEREHDLFTSYEYQPWTRSWVIRQEIKDKVFNEYDERYSPVLWTPFEYVCCENYGRGFIEQNIGDLRSLDALSERILDFAAVSSKIHPCIRAGSEVKPEDLAQPTGFVLTGCDIQGGTVQDVAFLRVDKIADFNVVNATVERLTSTLGAAMLLGAESVRRSERTTAYEVQQTTVKELEGALGGFYAPIADRQQVPLVDYVRYKMTKDKLLPPVPDEAVDVQVLTGIAALSRLDKANNLLSMIDIVRNLGPEIAARINYDVLIDVIMRYRGIYEPGVIKSPEQIEAERQQMMEMQAQAEAQTKAIDVAGNVAQAAMTPKG